MKGDFSRLRFDQAKHYTSVVAQQGRVQLDSDTNEQRAIEEFLRATGVIDIIGGSGAPVHSPGFAVTVTGGGTGIQTGAGRFYADGLLCDAPAAVDYMAQPFLLNPSPTAATLLAGLRSNAQARLHVWLEAWQRLVTPIDDPGIKDVALGEADTAGRLQTVWRVVAEAAVASGTTRSCCDDMRLPILQLLPGLMTVGLQDASGQGNCLPAPHAGYRGLENQLYRVEIHRGGDVTQATFKWSRDNASVVSAITRMAGTVVSVDSLGPDANLGFQPGQWIEISDDNDQFGQTPNRPGRLFQIASPGPGPLDITLSASPPAVGAHAKLRRWDQTGAAATANGAGMNGTGQNVLENGIFVQFSADRQFVAGDYWLIPARTATGAPEWPPSDSDGSPFQPAKNIRVHRAPLACIRFDQNPKVFAVEVCRPTFAPLTELTPPIIPQALHVTAIRGWQNDDVLTLDQLFVQGLTVTLDGAAATFDASSFIVELETPVPPQFEFLAREAASTANALLRLVSVMDGDLTITGSNIVWMMGRSGLIPLWEAQVTNRLPSLADLGIFMRARVTLKGRAIHDPSGQTFLDGQCFGKTATRNDGTPRTDLILPSGDNTKASDFESWFFIAPWQQISMTITPSAVAFVRDPNAIRLKLVDNTSGHPDPNSPAVVPTLGLSLLYEALSDTTLNFSVTGPSPSIVPPPQAVIISKGKKSPTTPVTLTVNNPGAGQVQTYTVTATFTLPSNLPASASATITVTGAPPPIIIAGPPPVFSPGPIVSPGPGS